MKSFLAISLLAASGFATTGCVAVAAAGAGYMLHDEATECDDEFDPLEDIRGKDDGCN